MTMLAAFIMLISLVMAVIAKLLYAKPSFSAIKKDTSTKHRGVFFFRCLFK